MLHGGLPGHELFRKTSAWGCGPFLGRAGAARIRVLTGRASGDTPRTHPREVSPLERSVRFLIRLRGTTEERTTPPTQPPKTPTGQLETRTLGPGAGFPFRGGPCRRRS